MRIGVFTPYRYDLRTQETGQLALALLAAGHDVQIFATAGHERVHALLDRLVTPLEESRTAGLDHAIYDALPEPEYWHPTAQRDLLFYPTQVLLSDLMSRASLFQRVLCPSVAARRVLRGTAIENDCRVHTLPQSLLLPQTLHDYEVDPQRINVCWFLSTGVPPTSLDVVEKSLTQHPQKLYWTLIQDTRVPTEFMAAARKLAHNWKERLAIVRPSSWEEAVLSATRHDLAYCPCLRPATAMPALLALTAGTPVLAYQHPVLNEVLLSGAEATGEIVRDHPLPSVYAASKINSVAMLDSLNQLLSSSDRLIELAANIHSPLAERRRDYDRRVRALYR